MNVGVFALQGDFRKHQEHINAFGGKALAIRKPQELAAISAFVIPGGESTTFLKLCTVEFRRAIHDAISQGLPTLATCAGLILLAKQVRGPEQESLGLIDVDVQRNAYGRQVDSFITEELLWTPEGREFLAQSPQLKNESTIVEGVFIRAPKISRVGSSATTFLSYGKDPVLVRQKNILGATFHPELSENSYLIHKLLMQLS